MNIARRQFLKNAGAIVAASLCGKAAAQAPARKPNIVVILADDLGYADAGFQGCPDIPTPHIDSIAAKGVRFTNGYVASPICSPSRAAIMTGRYPQRFGYWYNPGMAEQTPPQFGLPIEETTLAVALKQAGYATGCVGKWHLGLKPAMRPLSRGFDEFFGFLHVSHPYRDALANPHNPILRNDNPDPVDEKDYLTDAFTREAVDFVNRRKDNPFFLYLAYNAPHDPPDATQKYLDRVASIADPRRRTYAAMVAALDDGVGRVIDALRKNGLYEDTLVIFLSDNGGPPGGPYSNGELSGGKCSLGEGGIRVPFVMQWPRQIAGGATYDAPVISLDIFPTCVAAANGQTAKGLDGVDLTPFVKHERQTPPHGMLFWRWFDERAARGEKYKLVLDAKPVLYDLSADAREAKNIAGEHPDIVDAMRRRIEEWDRQLKPPLWPNK